MTRYPLLFQYRDKLTVRGSLVEVTVRGRALVVEEDGGWWMYGVAPGGLAEDGLTFGEATASFWKTFSEILQDIVGSAVNVDGFRDEVEDFFTTNEHREREWQAAVAEVRAGNVQSDLPQESAESPRGVDVRIVGAALLSADPPLKMAA